MIIVFALHRHSSLQQSNMIRNVLTKKKIHVIPIQIKTKRIQNNSLRNAYNNLCLLISVIQNWAWPGRPSPVWLMRNTFITPSCTVYMRKLNTTSQQDIMDSYRTVNSRWMLYLNCALSANQAYLCVCACMRVCCVCVYVCMCASSLSVWTCMCMCVHVFYVCMWAYVCVCVKEYVCLCACVLHVCACACVRVCVCVHGCKQTHTHNWCSVENVL